VKIYLGADHAGFELKIQIYEHLVHSGYEIEDIGAKTLEAEDDYPQYAYSVAVKVLGDDSSLGILICGSGQGMSIAANRVRGIRAALAWNPQIAAAAKTDDNANILVLPARFIDAAASEEIVDAWLKAEFKSDPKYHRRLDELEELYG
jgi:ribose 5-phosphate isomerase B